MLSDLNETKNKKNNLPRTRAGSYGLKIIFQYFLA